MHLKEPFGKGKSLIRQPLFSFGLENFFNVYSQLTRVLLLDATCMQKNPAFRFPDESKNLELFQVWIRFVNLPESNWKPSSSSVPCTILLEETTNNEKRFMQLLINKQNLNIHYSTRTKQSQWRGRTTMKRLTK